MCVMLAPKAPGGLSYPLIMLPKAYLELREVEQIMPYHALVCQSPRRHISHVIPRRKSLVLASEMFRYNHHTASYVPILCTVNHLRYYTVSQPVPICGQSRSDPLPVLQSACSAWDAALYSTGYH